MFPVRFATCLKSLVEFNFIYLRIVVAITDDGFYEFMAGAQRFVPPARKLAESYSETSVRFVFPIRRRGMTAGPSTVVSVLPRPCLSASSDCRLRSSHRQSPASLASGLPGASGVNMFFVGPAAADQERVLAPAIFWPFDWRAHETKTMIIGLGASDGEGRALSSSGSAIARRVRDEPSPAVGESIRRGLPAAVSPTPPALHRREPCTFLSAVRQRGPVSCARVSVLLLSS